MDLILATLAFAAISVPVVALLLRTWVNPCTLYWIGWIAGAIGAKLSADSDLMPELSRFGEILILRAHVGAFVAFLLVGAAARFVSPNEGKRAEPIKVPDWLWTCAIVAVSAQFLVGSAMLVQRVHEDGLGALGDVYNIRQQFLETNYLQEELPPIYRVFSFATCFASIAPILLAIKDANRKGFSGWQLLMLFVCAAPGGVSTGGRIWLAVTISMYCMSYVLAGDMAGYAGTFRRLLKHITLPALALLVMFAAIGIVREKGDPIGGLYETYGADRSDRPLYPLYMYLGTPVIAVGPYSEYATQQHLLKGLASLPWISDQLERLHYVYGSPVIDATKYGRDYVREYDDHRLAATHASVIPQLVLDFGIDNLEISSALRCALVFVVWLFFKGKGAPGHIAATVACLYGAMFSFQDVTFGAAASFLPVIFAFGLLGVRSLFRAAFSEAAHRPLYRRA